MSRGVTFKKKKQNRISMIAITMVIFVICIVIATNYYTLSQKRNALLQKEAELTAQIEAENERTQELVELKKYTQTKKYAEEVAKEKLGLVYEDEIIFKPQE